MFVLVQTIKRTNVIVKIIQQNLFIPPAMCNMPGSPTIVLGHVVSIYTSIFFYYCIVVCDCSVQLITLCIDCQHVL